MRRLLLYVSDISDADSKRKIEDEIFSLPGVTGAEFTHDGHLVIESEENGRLPSVMQVANVIKTVYPDVTVSKERSTVNSLSRANLVFTGGISLLCFLLSLILPVPGVFKLILQIGSALFSGYDTLLFAVKSAKSKKLDDNIVMLAVTVAAFAIGSTAEAAAVMLIFRLGKFAERYLSLRLYNKAGILGVKIPSEVTAVDREGQGYTAKTADLEKGSFITPEEGSVIPFDCTVSQGRAVIDCSSITGDQGISKIGEGGFIPGGSICLGGDALLKTESTVSDSTCMKIKEMISSSKSQSTLCEKKHRKFFSLFLVILLAVAILAVIVPAFIMKFPIKATLYNAIVIITAAAPFTLLAVSQNGFGGIFTAATACGVFASSPAALEKLAKERFITIDRDVLNGRVETAISDIVILGNMKESDMLVLAASMSEGSEDKVYKAIANAAGKNRVHFEKRSEKAGLGYAAIYKGKTFLCGNLQLLDKIGIDCGEYSDADAFICYGNKLLGAVYTEDIVHGNCNEIARKFKESGFHKVYMLEKSATPDSQTIAELAGVDSIVDESANTLYLGNSSEQIRISSLSASSSNNAADIMIGSKYISALARVKNICQRGLSVIGLNFWLISNLKAIVVILGFFGYMPLTVAIILEILSSLCVIVNNSRIQKFK